MYLDTFETASFSYKSAFRPHETSESMHWNHIFFKLSSRVDYFGSDRFGEFMWMTETGYFLSQLRHKPGSRLKWKLCQFKMADNNVLLFWQVEKCWLKALEVEKILSIYYRSIFVWASESRLDTPHRVCVCSFSISRFVWTWPQRTQTKKMNKYVYSFLSFQSPKTCYHAEF